MVFSAFSESIIPYADGLKEIGYLSLRTVCSPSGMRDWSILSAWPSMCNDALWRTGIGKTACKKIAAISWGKVRRGRIYSALHSRTEEVCLWQHEAFAFCTGKRSGKIDHLLSGELYQPDRNISRLYTGISVWGQTNKRKLFLEVLTTKQMKRIIISNISCLQTYNEVIGHI